MASRKLKTCSGCGKDSYLWKSNPPLCKTCAMRSKARNDDSDKKVSVPQKKKKVPKRIAPVSEKQKERLAEYRKVRDKYLKENPTCARCGTTNNLSLHHLAGREGNLLTDVDNFMTLCIPCHSWVTDFTRDAIGQGFARSRLNKKGES